MARHKDGCPELAGDVVGGLNADGSAYRCCRRCGSFWRPRLRSEASEPKAEGKGRYVLLCEWCGRETRSASAKARLPFCQPCAASRRPSKVAS